MPKIESIGAYDVFDALGLPAVRIVVTTEQAGRGIATVSVQSSASAVHAVTAEIQAALIGRNSADQTMLDKRLLELDGTSAKKRLGTSVLWGVSVSIAKAEAKAQGLPFYLYLKQLFPKRPLVLPIPYITMVEQAEAFINRYMIIPVKIHTTQETFQRAKAIYDFIHHKHNALNTIDSEIVFSILMHACEQQKYTPGEDIMMGICINPRAATVPSTEIQPLLITWRERYPLLAIIDSTSDICSPPEIGTLSEVLQTILKAEQTGQPVIMDSIVDVAVATQFPAILLGPPQHAENIEQYNRLMMLEALTKGRYTTMYGK